MAVSDSSSGLLGENFEVTQIALSNYIRRVFVEVPSLQIVVHQNVENCSKIMCFQKELSS